MFNGQFRAIPEAVSFFQTEQFALLPRVSFISLLSSNPSVGPTTLELEQEDFDMFQKLQRGLACIKEAMRLFRKQNLKMRAPQGGSGEDE
jgi:hypothetical protein